MASSITERWPEWCECCFDDSTTKLTKYKGSWLCDDCLSQLKWWDETPREVRDKMIEEYEADLQKYGRS